MRVHGGDREARIDFSSNLNPLGPPRIVYDILRKCVESSVLEKYPDYTYKSLRRILAEFYSCREEFVVPTSGAGEAINLAILSARPRVVVVVEPSYGEYEDFSRVLGVEYRFVLYRRKNNEFYLDLSDLDNFCNEENVLIVVTNPNNPLGIYVDRTLLLDYFAKCRSRVLIDEAYIEMCSKCSIDVGSNIPNNIVLIRSMTKWLSLPGIRLGFLYTEDVDLFKKVEVFRQPWNVNSLAECLALELFRYGKELKKFIENSRRYAENEKNRIQKKLKEIGLNVYKSDTNYFLIETENSEHLIKTLRDRGIAVRNCSSFKGLNSNFIRIAVKRFEENNELIESIQDAYKEIKGIYND